jgi:Predicted membrane protein (DUF2232)
LLDLRWYLGIGARCEITHLADRAGDRGHPLASPKHPAPPEQQTSKVNGVPPGKPPIVLVETAFLAGTTSLLWLLSYYLPGIPVFSAFFPIPIALIYLRWGNRAGWITALVSGLLLSVLTGPTRSILFVIPYGIMGVQLGACWRRRTSWLTSISLGALLDCVGVFFRWGEFAILQNGCSCNWGFSPNPICSQFKSWRSPRSYLVNLSIFL